MFAFYYSNSNLCVTQATWDDYPNGRWGDARSPAYGEIDGYGVSLHMSISSAIKLWGTFSDATFPEVLQ